MSLPKAELTPPAGSGTGDIAWCFTVLPRVSRTFALNIRLLGPDLRLPVCVAYLLCRVADTLEDAWPGPAADVRARFGLLRRALAGDGSAAQRLAAEAAALKGGRDDHRVVAELPRLLRARDTLSAHEQLALAEALEVMTAGMCRYAARSAERGESVPYLDTEAELHDYCWVVAGCVGVMLTRLFEPLARDGSTASEARLALAPVVGEALQLTNILLDWPRDLRRGRCYLPAEWLAEAGVTPAELVQRDRPEVRALSARLEALARAALARVPDYLERVPARALRYRVFCLWPALWALASLRHARRDPDFPWGARRPRLPRTRLFGTALVSLPVIHSHRGVRRLFAAV